MTSTSVDTTDSEVTRARQIGNGSKVFHEGSKVTIVASLDGTHRRSAVDASTGTGTTIPADIYMYTAGSTRLLRSDCHR